MYRVTVPIMLASFTPEYRSVYLDQLLRGKIDRVMLTVNGLPETPEEEAAMDAALRETAPFLREAGLDVGFWIGHTIGHGVVLTHDCAASDNAPKTTPVTNLNGEEIPGTCCPLDPVFADTLCRRIRHLAEVCAPLGIHKILLDDDYRMGIHGKDPCCACDRHMARISSFVGKPVTREELRRMAFESPANEYRAAWLKAQSSSLEDLAARIGETVADIDEVTVSLCSAPCHSGSDGTSPNRLARLLGGKHAPFVRGSGAPYWPFVSSSGRTMPFVLEIARMFGALLRDGMEEIWAEGDVYPRPRTTIPAAPLELFDAAIRADGSYTGILKYMFDYTSSPTLETGYLDFHCADRPVLEAIGAEFAGKRPLGVRVLVSPETFSAADLSETDFKHYSSTFPFAGAMLFGNGIPTVYRGEGICPAVFGDDARVINLDEVRGGAILDAVSAKILASRGQDVGVKIRKTAQATVRRFFGMGDVTAAYRASGAVAIADLAPGAEVLLTAETDSGEFPLAVAYENAGGARFLTFLANAASFPTNSALYTDYLIQAVLLREIPRIARRPLPAVCAKHPGLCMIAAEDEASVSILLLNTGVDPVLRPEVRFPAPVRLLRAIGCEASAEGDLVRLSAPLPAYGFAALTVTK